MEWPGDLFLQAKKASPAAGHSATSLGKTYLKCTIFRIRQHMPSWSPIIFRHHVWCSGFEPHSHVVWIVFAQPAWVAVFVREPVMHPRTIPKLPSKTTYSAGRQ